MAAGPLGSSIRALVVVVITNKAARAAGTFHPHEMNDVPRGRWQKKPKTAAAARAMTDCAMIWPFIGPIWAPRRNVNAQTPIAAVAYAPMLGSHDSSPAFSSHATIVDMIHA